ncbi:citrate synthase [Enhydrobacter aerosaccus]|uniref:citrate synthase (unknown stereospecificity) n=1 Tax=Enhydrobacter aerosaccus TaxID=225324 RepID=A0A1T4KND5_9HYPH|nr:citrate synthase/methylcitrate synthase [Enhydrobacter aerosaccus]SJZ43909.1 citrate synthase [Enhydrobacter aerosaccus]
MLQTRVDSGLDGVIVADTVMSEVDGEAGRLTVRGHGLQELVANRGYEGVAALLWEGYGKGGGDESAVREGLAAARVHAYALVPRLLAASAGLSPVEALRVGLGMLPDTDPTPHHFLVCGALPVFLAALLNVRRDLPAVAPDPSLTTAQDLLRMIRGQRAGEAFEKGLDTYLATVADHGFNASTFTARVVASTHAGLISAVLAGLCALKGPLHGGAPGPVLDMLDEIGEADRAEGWFDEAFATGTRLMGFGHRVYKVRDPRADVLKAAVARLPSTAGRLAFAAEVEKGAIAALRKHKPGQRLETNVEYYTALLLEALDIPREAFTALFAAGRVAGWCAHIFEQEKGGRIIRPQSNYVGPRPNLAA